MTAPASPMSWGQIQTMARRRRPAGSAPPSLGDYSLGGYTNAADTAGGTALNEGSQASSDYLSRAENFNASDALNTWAQGAWGNVSTALQKQLGDLSGQAVGAGRLNTGFYDEDQGNLIKGVTSNFANQLAQQSLGAASLQSQSDQALGRFGQEQTQTGLDVAQSRREEMINAQREADARKRAQKRGIGSLIGGVLGAGTGAFFGGTGGAQLGATVGSSLGGVF
ncbi:MAG: hypothetical protein ACRDQZ_13040 [Mycobacteriales bacterium]